MILVFALYQYVQKCSGKMSPNFILLKPDVSGWSLNSGAPYMLLNATALSATAGYSLSQQLYYWLTAKPVDCLLYL
jgi:hypothetical protein